MKHASPKGEATEAPPMNSETATTSHLSPPNGQPVTFTGKQLLQAFESQNNALRSQINKFKLHNQKLTNPSLLKHTALNSLTSGQYRNLYDQQKAFTNNPIEQQKCRESFKDIEKKYTTPPHISELLKEIKALESLYSILVETNNKNIKSLTIKQSTILTEKRKLSGLEQNIFKPMTDKIAELPNDALYQSQIIRYANQRTR